MFVDVELAGGASASTHPMSRGRQEVGSGGMQGGMCSGDAGWRGAWTSQALSVNVPPPSPAEQPFWPLSLAETGHNEVALSQTEGSGHCVTMSPFRGGSTGRPFCCHAKTAAPTGTVSPFTESIAHPLTLTPRDKHGSHIQLPPANVHASFPKTKSLCISQRN